MTKRFRTKKKNEPSTALCEECGYEWSEFESYRADCARGLCFNPIREKAMEKMQISSARLARIAIGLIVTYIIFISLLFHYIHLQH